MISNDYDVIKAVAQERLLRENAPLESLDELKELRKQLNAERIAREKSEKRPLAISVTGLVVAIAAFIATITFGILPFFR